MNEFKRNIFFDEKQKMNNLLLDKDDCDEGMKILQDSVNEFTKVYKGSTDPTN